MKRAVLLLLATPGLIPAVGFAKAVSPSTGETLFKANGAHCYDCALRLVLACRRRTRETPSPPASTAIFTLTRPTPARLWEALVPSGTSPP